MEEVNNIEQIRCDCHGHTKIVAERDEQGNIYVQCRGCKEKIKIESIPQRTFLNLWPLEVQENPESDKTYWERCPHHSEIRRYERPRAGDVEFHCIGGDVHIIMTDSEALSNRNFVKEYLNFQMEKACKTHCPHMKTE